MSDLHLRIVERWLVLHREELQDAAASFDEIATKHREDVEYFDTDEATFRGVARGLRITAASIDDVIEGITP